MTIILGIAGSFVAGYIGRAAGWYEMGEAASFIASVIGAIVLLAIVNLVQRGRVRKLARYKTKKRAGLRSCGPARFIYDNLLLVGSQALLIEARIAWPGRALYAPPRERPP